MFNRSLVWMLSIFILVSMFFAGKVYTDSIEITTEAGVTQTENEPVEVASLSFGPVRAVERKVDDLDEKANEHWKEFFKDNSNDTEAIPRKVRDYWHANPSDSPSGFGAAAVVSTASSSADDAGVRDYFTRFQTEGIVASAPAVQIEDPDGPVVYFGSWDGNLYATTTGENPEELWSFPTGAAIQSSPAVGPDGNIYFGSFDGNVYSVDPNGNKNWAFETGDWVLSSPAVDGDSENVIIYIGSNDGNIYAINQEGDELGRFETGGRVTSSPAVIPDSAVFVGSWDNNMYALTPDLENKLWSYPTGGNVKSSPALTEDGLVVFGSEDGYVYAVHASSGELYDRIEIGEAITSSPAIGSDGTVYVGCWDHKLYGLGLEGGSIEILGTFETNGPITSSPAVGSDGTVYVGSHDKHFYAVSAAGEALWKVETGRAIGSSPNILYDVAIIGSGDNYVYGVALDATGLYQSSWPRFRQDIFNSGNSAEVAIGLPLPGSGTADDPYLVENWQHLDFMRKDLTGHFVLANNLDQNSAGYNELASPEANGGAGWEPVGKVEFEEDDIDYDTPFITAFSGSFDGQGYTISDLYIDRPDSIGVGLFAAVEAEGVVLNVGVENANITGYLGVGPLAGASFGRISGAHATGTVYGDTAAGGLIGANVEHEGDTGEILNSYADATVSGLEEIGGLAGFNEGLIDSSHAIGSVTTSGIMVGGLIGANNWHGIISNSYASGDVSGETDVGGLVGEHADGVITHSYATGEVNGIYNVGGLAGWSEGLIRNSYAEGTVFGERDVGGLVGTNDFESGIIASYATGNVSGSEYVGGLVGDNYAGLISNSYALGNVDGDNEIGGLVGHNLGTVEYSYSIGAVTATDTTWAGGLVGYTPDTTTVTASFWNVETSGITKSDGGDSKTTAEMRDIHTYLNAGWNIVETLDTANDSYPFHSGAETPIWLITAQPVETTTWYVNDEEVVDLVYTTTAGDDATGDGSADAPFRTISRALQEANTGDTILVDAGTYSDSMIIQTDWLTIAGADSSTTILDYGDSSEITGANAFVLDERSNIKIRDLQIKNYSDGIVGDTTYNIKLDNILVQNSGGGGFDFITPYNLAIENSISKFNLGSGFIIKDGDSVIIRNSLARNNKFHGFIIDYSVNLTVTASSADSNDSVGFYLFQTANSLLEDNQASNNLWPGFALMESNDNILQNNIADSNPTVAFLLNESFNNTLTSNSALNNDNGFQIEKNSNNNHLDSNEAFNGTGAGFRIELASENVLTGNTSTGNDNGFNLKTADNNILEINEAEGNTFHGIRLEASDSNTIAGNTSSNNLHQGIYLQLGSSNNTLQDNQITLNQQAGVWVIDTGVQNKFIANEITENANEGILMIDGFENEFVANYISSNDSEGISVISGSHNFFSQNDIKDNTLWQVTLSGDSNTFKHNNLQPSAANPMLALSNWGTGNNIQRNWWSMTDEFEIESLIDPTTNAFIPYRLGRVDTGVGAGTIAPADPLIDTAIAGTGEIEISWFEVTTNEDGSALNDFGEYRIYRTTDPNESDWKLKATLITSLANPGDTAFVDTAVQDGTTYYYRLTAVDNAAVENESYFSDIVAAEPLPPEPAFFSVEITEITEIILAGDSLVVTTLVTNSGDLTDTKPVGIDAQLLGSDSQTVSLAGGETTTVTFSLPTSSADSGEYTVTMLTDDDTDSQIVTVSVYEYSFLWDEVAGETYAEIIGYSGDTGIFLALPDTSYAGYSVRSIADKDFGDGVFQEIEISGLVIPGSFTHIGKNSFRANNLSGELTIPNSVESIGHAAFSFNSIDTLTLGNSLTSIGSEAFMENNISGELIIPDNVDIIDINVFAYNSIDTLTLGNNVTSIGSSAFRNNNISGNLTIPNNVGTIDGWAFRYNFIDTLVLGNNVSIIDDYAFDSNNLSGELTLPVNVEMLSDSSFANNPIDTAVIYNDSAVIGLQVFHPDPHLTTIMGGFGSTAETYASENGHPFKSLDTYTLTINLIGDGNVEVDGVTYIDPLTVTAGETVTLEAIADTYWHFVQWDTDLVGSDTSVALFIDGNKNVSATFAQDTYTLTVDVVGDGSVEVDGVAYIDPLTVTAGETVTLEALADTYWHFVQWDTDLVGSDTSVTLFIDGDKTIGATFAQDTYTLTVDVVGDGSVEVDGTAYIDPLTVTAGETVTLGAIADTYWHFVQWDTDLAGSDTLAGLFIDGDKTIGATFAQDTYTLTVDVVGDGDVLVDGDTYETAMTVTAGETVTLEAVPAEGWLFSQWETDLTGSDTFIELFVDSDKTVSALFLTPAFFSVEITEITEIILAGDSLVVTTLVTNSGDLTDTKPVGIDAQLLGSDSQTVSLAGGETTTVTFSLPTSSADSGEYTVTMLTDDDTDSQIVTVSVYEYSFLWDEVAGETYAEITAYSGDTGIHLTLPDTYLNYPVRSIADKGMGLGVFQGIGLTGIDFPAGFTHIGDWAFENNSLDTLTLGDSLTYIGDYAFDENNISGVLIIPDNLETIGDYAFRLNNISGELIIPDSVETIGGSAFTFNSIETLTLGNNVTSIGSSAFRNNNISGELTFSENVGTIGDLAFEGNSIDTAVIYNDSATFGTEVFHPDPHLTTIIGWSHSTAQDYAHDNGHPFGYLDYEFTLEWDEDSSETYAEITAYSGDTGIHLTLPDTYAGYPVRSIADMGMGDGVFENIGLTGLTIPTGFTHIGNYAFRNNSISALTLGDSLTTIGMLAFLDNNISGELTIPDNVEIIGGVAFGNNFIDTLTLGDSLTTIYNEAFINNNISGELIIPDSVETIDNSAFKDNSIDTVVIYNDSATIGLEVFHPDTGLTTIIGWSHSTAQTYAHDNGHPFGYLDYELTLEWDVDAGETYAEITAYSGATGIHLTLPDTYLNYPVRSIADRGAGDGVFELKSLTGVDIPAGFTHIGNFSFYWNNISGELIIPDSVKSIGASAFRDEGIDTLTLGTNLTSVGDRAFRGNNISGELIIPDSVESIGISGFYDNSIDILTLGSNLITIGNEAFYLNNISGELIIPDNVETIGGSAFTFNSIETLTLGNNVTSIGSSAFRNNNISGELTFSENVGTIGDLAFENNSIDTSVIYNDSAAIGTEVFHPDTGLTTIKGYLYSTAETYAIDNGHPFVALAPEIMVSPDELMVYPEEPFDETFTLNLTGEIFDGGLGEVDITVGGQFSELTINTVTRINDIEAEVRLTGSEVESPGGGEGTITVEASGLVGEEPLTATVECYDN